MRRPADQARIFADHGFDGRRLDRRPPSSLAVARDAELGLRDQPVERLVVAFDQQRCRLAQDGIGEGRDALSLPSRRIEVITRLADGELQKVGDRLADDGGRFGRPWLRST